MTNDYTALLGRYHDRRKPKNSEGNLSQGNFSGKKSYRYLQEIEPEHLL
jgi:hypothetical protein